MKNFRPKNGLKITALIGLAALVLTGCFGQNQESSTPKMTTLPVITPVTPPANTDQSTSPDSTPLTPVTPPTSKTPSGKIEVALTKDFTKFAVTKDGKELASAALPASLQGVNGEAEAKILKQTPQSTYIQVCATGFGGYILYNFCYGSLYKMDLATNVITDLKIEHTQDVSPDETMVASVDTKNNKIIITTVATGKQSTFSVLPEFGQYGDVKFSPDSTKFAYAAAVGDPQNESGKVFKVDIKSKNWEAVARSTKSSMNVLGWKDNDTVDYK